MAPARSPPRVTVTAAASATVLAVVGVVFLLPSAVTVATATLGTTRGAPRQLRPVFGCSRHHPRLHTALRMCGASTPSSPRSPVDAAAAATRGGALGALAAMLSPRVARALSPNPVENAEYSRALWNVPSDDFWYPPYLIGRWNATFKFAGARFTSKVPLEQLAQNENLPGFSKYSVLFVPDMGRDVSNVTLRWVQLDAHPREDHPFNVRQLVHAFAPDATVDAAPYAFQKAPDVFHSPANRWSVRYHDGAGEGAVDLLTLKRNIQVFADTVETTEYFRQTHTRRNYIDAGADGSPQNRRVGQPSVVASDYALNWRFKTTSSERDEFVQVEDLGKTRSLLGNLDVLVYFQPTNDLYFTLPGTPAGVFSYNLTLERLGDPAEETQATMYPFVPRGDGPVELDQFFGY
jgi:hypothetical protein